MNRDTDDLLESIDEDLSFILEKQREALTSDEIEEISAVKIKNISENMRSILDFIAVKIVEISGIKFKGNIYFPYGKDIVQLEERNKWVRELKTKNKDLYNIIVSYQDFNLSTNNRWIIQLCNLSIKVKHNELERPKRQDSGKVTTVGNLFRIEGNSEVHVEDLNIIGLQGGPRKLTDFRIGKDVKHKEVSDKAKQAGLNSTLTYSEVKFITSNGDDIIKVFSNSLSAIREICKLAKKFI